MTESTRPYQRSWVTVVGWSPMAVVNTVWQACESGIVPDRVVLLVDSRMAAVRDSAALVESYLAAILPQYGVRAPRFERRDVDENDFRGFRDTSHALSTKGEQQNRKRNRVR